MEHTESNSEPTQLTARAAGKDGRARQKSPLDHFTASLRSILGIHADIRETLDQCIDAEISKEESAAKAESLEVEKLSRLRWFMTIVLLGVIGAITYLHSNQTTRRSPLKISSSPLQEITQPAGRDGIRFDSRGKDYFRLNKISSNKLIHKNNTLSLSASDSLPYEERLKEAALAYVASRPAELNDIPLENIVFDRFETWDITGKGQVTSEWMLAYAHFTQQVDGLDVNDTKAILTIKVTPDTLEAPKVIRIAKNFFPEVLSLPDQKIKPGAGIKHLRKRLGSALGETVEPEFKQHSIRYFKGRWRTVEDYFVSGADVHAAVSSDGETYVVEARQHIGPEQVIIRGSGNRTGAFNEHNLDLLPLEDFPYTISCLFDPLLHTFSGSSRRGGQLFSLEARSWLLQRLNEGGECFLETNQLGGNYFFLYNLQEIDAEILPFSTSWDLVQHSLDLSLRNPTIREIAANNILYHVTKANQFSVLKALRKTREDIGLPSTTVRLEYQGTNSCGAAAVSDRALLFDARSDCKTAVDSIIYHEFFHLLHSRSTGGRVSSTGEALADIFSAHLRGSPCIGPLDNETIWRMGYPPVPNGCIRNISGTHIAPSNVDIEILANEHHINKHLISLPFSSAFWEIRNIPGMKPDIAVELFLGAAFHSGATLMGEHFLAIMDIAKLAFEAGIISCDVYENLFRAFEKRGFAQSSFLNPAFFNSDYYFNTTCQIDPSEGDSSAPPLTEGDSRTRYLDDALNGRDLDFFVDNCSGPSCQWNAVHINWNSNQTGDIPNPPVRPNGAKAPFYHISPYGGGVKQHRWERNP